MERTGGRPKFYVMKGSVFGMVWWLQLRIIEGERYLRFHDGDCWMLRPTGAFQRYKGIPPDSGRVQSFLLRACSGGYPKKWNEIPKNL